MKKIKIVIKQGNIAQEDVDCIVVPQPSNCASYDGIAGLIKDAGMELGLKTYDEIARKTPLDYGEEWVVQSSGKEGIILSNVSLIGVHTNKLFYAVAKGTLQSLTSADALGAKTVAIPELGFSDIGKFTPEQSAQVVLYGIDLFDTICVEKTLQEVRLITSGSTSPAEKVLREKSYQDLCPKKGQKKFDLYIWLNEIKKYRDSLKRQE